MSETTPSKPCPPSRNTQRERQREREIERERLCRRRRRLGKTQGSGLGDTNEIDKYGPANAKPIKITCI